MDHIKSNKGFYATVAVVAAFALFAGAAFVQSQDVKAQRAVATPSTADGKSCPYAKEAGLQQSSSMPGSCAELHNQALAAGRMSKANFDAARTELVSVKGSSSAMTPQRCRELLAELGIECDEKDLLACAKKLQALGFCKEMTAAECAAMLAGGTCNHGGGTLALHQGGCCASGAAARAGAHDAAVTPAVATERVSAKGKQCDWTKGSCAPGTTVAGIDAP